MAFRRKAVRGNKTQYHTHFGAGCRFEQVEGRFNYVTAKTFLGNVTLFRKTLEAQRARFLQERQRLETGIEYLQGTFQAVHQIEYELNVKQAEVELKKENVNAFAERVRTIASKICETVWDYGHHCAYSATLFWEGPSKYYL